jgi:hypothetical protein
MGFIQANIPAGFVKMAMKALPTKQKKELALKIAEQLKNQIEELKKQTEGLFEISFEVSENIEIKINLKPNF